MNRNIYPCLWFDQNADEAALLYEKAFGARVLSKSPVVTELEINQQKLLLLNGGPMFKVNATVSLMLIFDNDQQLQNAWELLSEGGKALMEIGSYPFADRYGWIQDRFGVTWQLYFKAGYAPEQVLVPTIMYLHENNGKARAAMELFTSLFPKANIEGVLTYKEGGETNEILENVQHAQFSLNGYTLACMDSSHDHPFDFNEGVSMVVVTENQEETDKYWYGLVADGGQESRCAWLKDKFGMSWQIVPKQLMQYMSDKDNPEGAKRAMEAMLKMNKIIIADLEAAFKA